jgi:WD40 repeat protein
MKREGKINMASDKIRKPFFKISSPEKNKSKYFIFFNIIFATILTQACNAGSRQSEVFYDDGHGAFGFENPISKIYVGAIGNENRSDVQNFLTALWIPNTDKIAVVRASTPNLQIYNYKSGVLLSANNVEGVDFNRPPPLSYINKWHFVARISANDNGGENRSILGKFDALTGKREVVFLPQQTKALNGAHLGDAVRFIVSRDGLFVAAIGVVNGPVMYSAIFDTESGQVVSKLLWTGSESDNESVQRNNSVGYPTALDFSHDSKKIAICTSRDSVYLFDVKSGAILKNFKIGLGHCSAIVFSPNDDLLAASSYMDGMPHEGRLEEPTLDIWRTQNGQHASHLYLPDRVQNGKREKAKITTLAWDAVSANLAAASIDGISVWRTATAKATLLWSRQRKVDSSGIFALSTAIEISYSTSGHLLLRSNNIISVY